MEKSIKEIVGKSGIVPVFITGKARTGADFLIIRWCKEFGYRWAEYPANWEEFGKAAGMVRNRAMGKVATHIVCYWDGHSSGTRNMLECVGVSFKGSQRKPTKIPVYLALINSTEKDNEDGW